MQTLTSWFDIQNIVGDVGYATFNFKDSGQLHIGHESLINTVKNNSQVSVACFFNHSQIINSLFGGGSYTNSPFDETYCTNWLQNLNVDYLVIAESNLIDLINQSYDSTAIMEQVETYIQTENYSEVYTFPYVNDSFKINDLKYFLFFYILKDLINVNLNGQKKVMCWKDGIVTFLQKYHIDKYKQPGLFTIIDPSRRADGLQYSTSLFSKSQPTINFYISVKALLDQWGNNQIDKPALDQACIDLEEGTTFQVRVPFYYENMFGFNKLCECNILDTTTSKSFMMVEKY